MSRAEREAMTTDLNHDLSVKPDKCPACIAYGASMGQPAHTHRERSAPNLAARRAAKAAELVAAIADYLQTGVPPRTIERAALWAADYAARTVT